RLRWRLLKRMPGLIQADFMSLARGSGFDLQHIQPYQEGDDVRRIDWHASARSEQLQIRQMQEDREFTAWLVVDLSASSAAGFDAQSKRDQVIALSDCVIESIAQHGNRIGLWIDDGRQTPALRIKPRQGRLHRLNLLAALKGHQPPPKDAKAQSHLERLFRQLYAALRRRALVIVLSDFIDHSGQDAKTWSEALRQLRSRHDVVAVKINDPSDWELPERGYFLAEDAESGEQLWVDADDPGFRARFADAVRQEQLDLQQLLRQSGARLMQISHQDDALRALSRWMRRRS
ncbi:MAG: DUF58 domain-containing protein, partial [Betaproteobacteria bacterium]|nr:DUF58 domain-containing protein [Betaproteobacteria bacterium]